MHCDTLSCCPCCRCQSQKELTEYFFTIRSDPRSTAQSYGPECDAEVRLEAIDSLDTLEDALFMMETSGGSRLTARQACGVESAAMKA